MAQPNTTITTTGTLTDATGSLITGSSTVTVDVNFPDLTSSHLTATNTGSGVYQVTYNTKGIGLILEVWNVVGPDGSVLSCHNHIAVSY